MQKKMPKEVRADEKGRRIQAVARYFATVVDRQEAIPQRGKSAQ